MSDPTTLTGAALAAAAVVVLLLLEIARLRGAPRRARRLAMYAPPLVLGFLGVAAIRFYDLL